MDTLAPALGGLLACEPAAPAYAPSLGGNHAPCCRCGEARGKYDGFCGACDEHFCNLAYADSITHTIETEGGFPLDGDDDFDFPDCPSCGSDACGGYNCPADPRSAYDD